MRSPSRLPPLAPNHFLEGEDGDVGHSEALFWCSRSIKCCWWCVVTLNDDTMVEVRVADPTEGQAEAKEDEELAIEVLDVAE